MEKSQSLLYVTRRTSVWEATSQDCLLSMILRMVSLRAWWTKGVAVAFMYCSIRVLASVVALNNVVASSGWRKSREGYARV